MLEPNTNPPLGGDLRRTGGGWATPNLPVLSRPILREANRITGPVILQQPDAVGEGFIRNHPLTTAQRNWEQWYDDTYPPDFWPEPSMSNGLGQLTRGDTLRTYPIFRNASEFLADSIMSDLWELTGAEEEQEEWYEERDMMFEICGRRTAGFVSYLDFGVVAVEDDILYAVDPKDYYRIGQRELRDKDAGHIMLFPWIDMSDAEAKQGADSKPYNRIDVVKVLPGKPPTIQTFAYSGNQIGTPVTGVLPSKIKAVFTVGNGTSWYGGAQDAVAALMISYSMVAKILNDWANRPLYIPETVLRAMQATLRLPEGAPPEMDSIRELILDYYRPLFFFDSANDMVPGDAAIEPALTAYFALIGELREQIDIMATIPVTAFGIDVGKGESGIAREKSMGAASAKVRRIRKQIARVFKYASEIMGAPGGAIPFEWEVPPYQSQEERDEQARAGYAANLRTQNEARSMMGLAVVPGGDKFADGTDINGNMIQALDDNIANGDNGNAPASSYRNGGAGANSRQGANNGR